MPEIVFNGGKFHLVWTTTATGESVQYTSSDDGTDWSDASSEPVVVKDI